MGDKHGGVSGPTQLNPERLQAVRSLVQRVLGPYMEQQQQGFDRVASLLTVSREIGQAGALLALTDHCKEDAAQDILRAAVVLIHGQMEEFLRTMARVLLPEGDEACLNEIPLAGLGGRKERFFLGKLVQHKGKIVDDLLRESVSEYLDRSNFNSTTEIANLLQALRFEVANHDKEFPAIQQMIERRHQIVHRADRFEDAGASATIQPIKFDEVTNWLRATQDFLFSLRTPLFVKLCGTKRIGDLPL